MSAALSNLLHYHHRGQSCVCVCDGDLGTRKLQLKYSSLLFIFFNTVILFETDKTHSVAQQRRYLFPTEWRTVCDTCFCFLTKQPAQCNCTVARIEIPRRRRVDGCFSPLIALLFFFFFFSSPNNSKAWMQPCNETTTHWNHSDTNLTSRTCATQSLFCFWQMTEDYLFSIMQTGQDSFDVCILTLPFSLFWLCLCLCSIRRLCSIVKLLLCGHCI